MSTDQKSQNQKEKKVIFHPWRVFIVEVLLFSLTLVLGVVSAFRINEILTIQEVPLPNISLWDFLFSFLLVTLIILFLVFSKFKKGKGVIYKVIFVLAVFWGGAICLSLWLSDIWAIIITGLLITLWFKRPSVWIHDLIMILGLAGAGSILGIGFDPRIVIVLLIVFSIYDFVAVYKTKHMVEMVKDMIERGVILGFIVPIKISDFREDFKKVKQGGRFLILGGGDVVFPLLLAVSLTSEGILNPLIIMFCALIGLFISYLLFISQKVRQPIPALPPIALFSIIGYLITRLI